MSRRLGGLGGRARLAAAGLVLAAILGLGAVPPAARAAEPSFGPPRATAAFGRAVEFEQPVEGLGPLKRVEILVWLAEQPVPTVRSVPPPDSASTTLRYALDLTSDHLLPNTPLTARWRLTDPAGQTWLGPPVRIVYADDRFRWRTRAGDLVRVHWVEGDAAFGARALRIAEAAVAEAEALLGVREERPIDFFIYADEQAFYDALGPGTRENVGGQANAEIRTLFAQIGPGLLDSSWVGVVIPHELTHLVFDTAVRNPYHFPPRWLNEGLAVYLSEGYAASDRSAVLAAARDGSLVPLSGLTAQFPTRREAFFLAYSESVSAVDFLVRRFGRDALVALVRSYAAGVTDDEAFRAALGVDAAGFEAAWLADLGAPPPTRYGPQPAPPGPVPDAWRDAAPGPTASPGASRSPAPAASRSPTPGEAPTTDAAALVGVLIALGLLAALGGAAMAGRRRLPSDRQAVAAEPGSADEPGSEEARHG
ncbi:MAG: hypothetical protein KatS3mg065_0418 [Chloroflexota bacterium]|nr:MAG: hypothetical protein KatS3mg065_0418 [Chloroflexota bacterium]